MQVRVIFFFRFVLFLQWLCTDGNKSYVKLCIFVLFSTLIFF
uniref:Uncharacterized protein n=1 Tax=Anguilla anguilla TaxID=7936 RepID=A0A0E9QL38_ANGAN